MLGGIEEHPADPPQPPGSAAWELGMWSACDLLSRAKSLGTQKRVAFKSLGIKQGFIALAFESRETPGTVLIP